MASRAAAAVPDSWEDWLDADADADANADANADADADAGVAVAAANLDVADGEGLRAEEDAGPSGGTGATAALPSKPRAPRQAPARRRRAAERPPAEPPPWALVAAAKAYLRRRPKPPRPKPGASPAAAAAAAAPPPSTEASSSLSEDSAAATTAPDTPLVDDDAPLDAAADETMPHAVWALVLDYLDLDALEACRWVSRDVRALVDADDYRWRGQLERLVPAADAVQLQRWRQAFGGSWRRLCRHVWHALQATTLGRLPTLREVEQVVPPAARWPAKAGPRRRCWTATVEVYRQGNLHYNFVQSQAGFYGMQISADPALARRSRLMLPGLPACVRAGFLQSGPPDHWRVPASLVAEAAAAGSARPFHWPWVVVAVCADVILFVRVVTDDLKDTAEHFVSVSLPSRVHRPTGLALLTRPAAAPTATTAAPVMVAAVAVSYFVYLYDALVGAPLIWPERALAGNVLETPRPIAALHTNGHYLVASLDDGSLCLWPLEWHDEPRPASSSAPATAPSRAAGAGAASLLSPLPEKPLHVLPPRLRSLVPPVVVQVLPHEWAPPAEGAPARRDTQVHVRVAYQTGALEAWAVSAKRAKVVSTGLDASPPPSPFGEGLRGRVWEFVDEAPALAPEILLVQLFGMRRPSSDTFTALGDALAVDPYRRLSDDGSGAVDPLVEPAYYGAAVGPGGGTGGGGGGGGGAAATSGGDAAGAVADHGARRLRSLDELLVQAYGVPAKALAAHGGLWSVPSPVVRHRPAPASGAGAGPSAGPRALDAQLSVLLEALRLVDPAARPVRGMCAVAWRQLELRCWEALHTMRRLVARRAADQWLPLTSVPWVRGKPADEVVQLAHELLREEHALPGPPPAAASAAAAPASVGAAETGRQRRGRRPAPRASAAVGAAAAAAAAARDPLAALQPMRRSRGWLCVRVGAPKWDLPHLYMAWQQLTWRAAAQAEEADSTDSTDSSDDGDDASGSAPSTDSEAGM